MQIIDLKKLFLTKKKLTNQKSSQALGANEFLSVCKYNII